MRLNEKQTLYARQLVAQTSEDSFAEQYDGVLFCEGEANSVDVSLYQKVYPSYFVVPVGGWSSVITFQRYLRRRVHSCPIYGIIDRDDLSKKEIKKREKEGIYCTKLPFIENIIASPEVIELIGKELGIPAEQGIEDVERKLMKILGRRLNSALPVNMGLEENVDVSSITVTIRTASVTVIEKTVSCKEILYTYRDKAVANEAAVTLGLSGKKQYYDFFRSCLENPRLTASILKSVSRYLPEIPGTQDESL